MARKIVSFLLDRVPGTDEARVRCRVKWDGCRKSVSVSIGYRVNISRWDMEMQRCVPRSFHGRSRIPAADINRDIERFRNAVDLAFLRLESEGRDIDPSQVRDALMALVEPEKKQEETSGDWKRNPIHAFNAFMAERGDRNRWTDATYTKMRNVKHHLQEWRPKLRWEDFDEDGLYDYIRFLRTSTAIDNKSATRGLKDSTVSKHVGMLKWFLRWADNKGLLKSRDYQSFKPKIQTADNPVIFLEWDELMKMMRLDLNDTLARTRDAFCFCCFTSLRYSDVKALRWSDVDDKCIRVTTVKTTDSLIIELNKYSQELLDRCFALDLPSDLVFDVPANQIMNERIKDVARLCGLNNMIRTTEFRNGQRIDKLTPKWQLIGTHAGRRTFICNALMMGIAPNVVMQWTGHSDYESMKPYIAIADTFKAEQMSKFNEK